MKLIMGCLSDDDIIVYICKNEKELSKHRKFITKEFRGLGLLSIVVWDLSKGKLPKNFLTCGKLG